MDFLRIRQKAKERASPAAPTRPRPPIEVPLAAVAAFAPALTAADVERIEDALGAELAAVGAGAPVSLPVPAPPRARPAPEPPSPADPLASFFWREGEEAPGVLSLAEPAAARPPEAPEPRSEWLTFQLGDEAYGVEIAHVREILKAPAITEVPRAPAHVLGVIMVRGEVIAVFDPRRRLGLPPQAPGPRARVVVCDAGEGPRGVLVDAVAQVVRLPASALEARRSGIGGAAAEYISAIGRDRGQLLVLLDLPALLRDGAPPRAEPSP